MRTIASASASSHNSNWYIWSYTDTHWVYRCGCGRCDRTKLVRRSDKVTIAGHRDRPTRTVSVREPIYGMVEPLCLETPTELSA